jgi:hypothetical protein
MDSYLATAAYLTPAEGLLSHARLADQGIESRVEGVDLVNWLWHLSLALRGVTLVVRAGDAQRAAEVLATPVPVTTESQATRQCGDCGETLPGDWLVCWRCGTNVDADRDPSFFAEAIRPMELVKFVEGVEFLGLWILFAAVLITIVPASVFAFALMLFVLSFRNQSQVVTVSFPPDEFAAYPDLSLRPDDDIETNRRALASAMFGLVWFPPLTLYSIWILLNSDEVPNSQASLWRLHGY